MGRAGAGGTTLASGTPAQAAPAVIAPTVAGVMLTDPRHDGAMPDTAPPHDHHVGLCAGLRSDGSPFIELVPARRLADGLYEVLGTPGMANGCARGDHISVDADGGFEVVMRGGHVAVHFYPPGPLAVEDIAALRRQFADLNGDVEAPTPAKFAVVTVPVAVGFPAIERAVDAWLATRPDIEWHFGNVYDDDDAPLGWWSPDATG